MSIRSAQCIGGSLILWLLCQVALAATPVLELSGYQQPNGAITVTLHGDRVDPYFATKALLVAQDAGLNAEAAATAWINWLIPFQDKEGHFDRICKDHERYYRCASADADDALLALWIELLVRFSPKEMPPTWQASMKKATQYLATLYDPHTGLYHISRTLPVALLMDNVEVYEASLVMSNYHKHRGNKSLTQFWQSRAKGLRQAIDIVFWRPGLGYQVSTQTSKAPREFYPEIVAQIFPLLVQIPPPGTTQRVAYTTWMRTYREQWLAQAATDYPWGLVALLSHQFGDRATVACWRSRAEPFRHGSHWNVLEEALYLAFSAELTAKEVGAPACLPFPSNA